MQKKVYINRNTGEVFDAESLTLSNICNGTLERQFQDDLHLLASRMLCQDIASINIKIICSRDISEQGEPVMSFAYETKLDLPKVKSKDENLQYINQQNEVLIKKEPADLFSDLPQIPENSTCTQDENIIDVDVEDDNNQEQ